MNQATKGRSRSLTTGGCEGSVDVVPRGTEALRDKLVMHAAQDAVEGSGILHQREMVRLRIEYAQCALDRGLPADDFACAVKRGTGHRGVCERGLGGGHLGPDVRVECGGGARRERVDRSAHAGVGTAQQLQPQQPRAAQGCDAPAVFGRILQTPRGGRNVMQRAGRGAPA